MSAGQQVDRFPRIGGVKMLSLESLQVGCAGRNG